MIIIRPICWGLSLACLIMAWAVSLEDQAGQAMPINRLFFMMFLGVAFILGLIGCAF